MTARAATMTTVAARRRAIRTTATRALLAYTGRAWFRTARLKAAMKAEGLW